MNKFVVVIFQDETKAYQAVREFWGLFTYLPAWFVILEFFAANLWNAFASSGDGSGVAFMAHVGGFVAGPCHLPLFRKSEPVAYEPWERLLRVRSTR